MKKLKLLTSDYLEKYSSGVNLDLKKIVSGSKKKNLFSKNDFQFLLQSSAIYSSNIEGNSIDFDTYLKNKKFKIKSKPKEMAEIDELVDAYNFAVTHTLNKKNFLEAHKILSHSILSLKSQRGKLRNQQVGIFSEGKIEYMAVEPEFVEQEFSKLFHDIKLLLSQKLSVAEIFYYASMIHLLFEKIHPFMDGNGRAGRLLEKWFLAAQIGEIAWSFQTEKYYSANRSVYYKNIHIGYNYYALKMEKCISFLLMLPEAIK